MIVLDDGDDYYYYDDDVSVEEISDAWELLSEGMQEKSYSSVVAG